MAVTLPYPTLSGVIVSTQLDSNFSTLATKFGNITDADVAAGAALGITKLSAYYQEAIVTMIVSDDDLAGAGWPAVGATTPLAWCPIPYAAATDEAWVITDVGWVCNDTGDGAGQFAIRWGAYSAAPAWVNVGGAVTTVTMTNSAGANDANDGRVTALAYSLDPANPIEQRSLAIVSAGVSATTLTAAQSALVVSIRMRRKLQGS